MINPAIKKLRTYFPQITQNTEDIYLDSASTTLKLKPAIDRVHQFYTKETSNVHRGTHPLSNRATSLFEKARETVAQFISAPSPFEIVFTRSVTDGINFLAQVLSPQLKPGDEILITEMEHHSNFLPWTTLALKNNLKVKYIPVLPSGELDLSHIDQLFHKKVKIFSFVHQSNIVGTVNSAQKLIEKARSIGALTIVDAAQSISTMDINVQKLKCDFLLFSGHKLFSPSGTGVLYGRESILNHLPPYQTGGGMVIDSLKRVWADPPHRFEAGTPPIEGVLALADSIQFLKKNISFSEIEKYEKSLLKQADHILSKIPGLRIIGTSPTRINTLSFVVDGLHSEDIGHIMGKQKVAVRAGHHCCLPLVQKMNLPSGTVRASFSVYNREEEIFLLEKSVKKAIDILIKGCS